MSAAGKKKPKIDLSGLGPVPPRSKTTLHKPPSGSMAGNSPAPATPPPADGREPVSAATVTAISPETLAYAMPGGLARFASGGAWNYARHLSFIEDKLLDVAAGKCKRLIISMPPGNGKSMLTSHYFPAWYLGRFPKNRIILTSYEANFAASWGRKARDVLEEFGPKIFGTKVSQNTAASDDWAIEGTNMGGMRTAGAGGSITGKHANLIIIDDPVKNDKDANSSKMQDDIYDWFRATVRTRQLKGCAIVIIMTRWSDNDLVGRLLQAQARGGEKWDYVCLSAIAEKDDPMGRKIGEPLWPEMFPLDFLLAERASQSSYWWAALYQQKPSSKEGDVVRMQWFRRYNDPPPQHDQVILSFDTAQKAAEQNDYTVIGVWHEWEGKLYLIDVIRERYTHPNLLKVTKELIRLHRPNLLLVEDKGSGTSLIQHLQLETSVPVMGIEPYADKVIRMRNETPSIETGRVYLPVTAPWLGEFEDEVRQFPRGNTRDQVDMMSQTLMWFRERQGGIDIL